MKHRWIGFEVAHEAPAVVLGKDFFQDSTSGSSKQVLMDLQIVEACLYVFVSVCTIVALMY